MKPRWFRFGLRTLFAVVTVFGIWLAIQVKWIRDRREFLSQPGVSHFSKGEFEVFPPGPPEIDPVAPGLLWLFGEKGVSLIEFETDNSAVAKQKGREARRLFPEAQVLDEDPFSYPVPEPEVSDEVDPFSNPAPN